MASASGKEYICLRSRGVGYKREVIAWETHTVDF